MNIQEVNQKRIGNKRILITSAPYSGTGYMYKFLEGKLNIGWEWFGENGVVS